MNEVEMFDFKSNCVSLSLITAICLITGCDNCRKNTYAPKFPNVEASEEKEAHFFSTNHDFTFSENTLTQIETLLRDTRAAGINNIGFMIISDKPVHFDKQEKVKRNITSMMNKFGFINSRIIDSGTCVYKAAKRGIRINILKYHVKEPDCSPWTESIGDMDNTKQLPRFGAVETYNLGEMVANKADLVVPRTYIGQRTKDAIEAAHHVGGSK